MIIIVKEQTNFRYLQIKGEYYASNSRECKADTVKDTGRHEYPPYAGPH